MGTHDVANAADRMARAVVPIFAPLLRDEELLDAFEEVRSALTPEVERLVATLRPACSDRHEIAAPPGGVP